MIDDRIARDRYWAHLTARAARIAEIQALAASKGNAAAVEAAQKALDFLGAESFDIFVTPRNFDRSQLRLDIRCAEAESFCDPYALDRRSAAEAHLETGSKFGDQPWKIDAVAAALIPAAGDETMGITDARNRWELALAEANRAKAALAEAMTRQDEDKSTRHRAQYLIATYRYGEALISYANAEADLQMATMTPKEAAVLVEEIEDADDTEE